MKDAVLKQTNKNLPGKKVLHFSSGGRENVVGFFPVVIFTRVENGDSGLEFSASFEAGVE